MKIGSTTINDVKVGSTQITKVINNGITYWQKTFAPATTYYVKNGGNDSLSGLDDANAWATISKLNLSTFNPGDQILFKCGSTWREQLTIPSSGNSGARLVFSSYGSGAKPKILGSNITTWTETSAGSHIWKSNTTFTDPYGTLTLESDIFFEEIDSTISWGLHKSNTGLLVSEHDWTWNANYIYVYSPADPGTRYISVEIPQRIRAILAGNNEYITIDNLELVYAQARSLEAYEVIGGTGFTIQNCHIHHTGCRKLGNGYNIQVVRNNVLIKNNILHDSGRRNISHHIYDFSNVTYTGLIIEGNTSYNCYHGGIGIAMDSVGVRSNNTFDNIIIRNNTMYDDTSRNTKTDGFDPTTQCALRVEEAGGVISNVQVYNNLFQYPTGISLEINNIDNAKVYNNTFYDFNHNGTAGGILQLDISHGSILVDIKNNIFYGNVDRVTVLPNNIYIESTQPVSDISLDYNLFYATDVTCTLVSNANTRRRYCINRPGEYTWAQMKTDIPAWQSHDQGTVDPLFISTTNYHLQPASLAIGHGVAISGLTTDHDGVNWNINPSIGYCEYVPVNAYYVSNTGSDTLNDGLTISTPWQTISKINGRTFNPGDQILFERGGVWREKLEIPSSGLPGSYITFSAYGSGVNPKILGSKATTTWTETSAGSHIWKTDITFINPRSVGFLSSDIIFNTGGGAERFGVFKANTGLFASEYDWTWNANYVYVYATSNPAVLYTGVEVPERDYGISTNDNEYLHFNGIDIFYAAAAGYDSNNDHTVTFKHGCIIENCEIKFIGGVSTGTSQQGFGTAITYSDMTIRHCNIHNCGRRSVSINMQYDGASLYTIGNILIEDNTFHDGYHTTSLDLTVNNGGNSASVDGLTFRRNIIYEDISVTPQFPSNQIWIQHYAGSGILTNIYIYSNIIKSHYASGIAMEGLRGDFHIYNNTFYNNIDGLGSYAIYADTDRGVPRIYIKNNAFYTSKTNNTNASGAFIVMAGLPKTYYIVDYNIYYRVDGTVRFASVEGISYPYTLTDWGTYKTNTGYDTHSPTIADPMFTSTTDYHLRSTSPAKNAGTDVSGIIGVTTDYGGTTWNSTPSIGAYEYVPVVIPTYYVSTTGNNSNDGLTISTPWQTLAWAESHATTAGNIIALKKGDTFSIDNVLAISHGGSVGNVNVWDGSLWGSGANAIIKANSDGGSIPKWYALVQIAGCNYVTMQNITFDGNAKNRHGITIGGCDQESGPIAQNDEHYITIQDCVINNFGTGSWYCMGILVQTWHNDMYNITIQRNSFDGCGAQSISFYPGRSNEGTPFAVPAEIHSPYVGYNTITNYGRSGSLGNGILINNKTTNAIVEHNTITDGASGTGLAIAVQHNEPNMGYFPTGCIVRYNKVTSTKTNSWCMWFGAGQAITCDVYYNIFIQGNNLTDTDGGCCLVSYDYGDAWTGSVINIWNNTMYSLSGRTFEVDTPTSGIVRSRNNIFYNTGTVSDIYTNCLCCYDYSGTITHSNNLYFRSANVNYLKVLTNGNYYNTNAQVLSWEATAKATDPLFITPGTDFHLQNTSPAANTGVGIGLTSDYEGTAILGMPDMGAFESAVVSFCAEYQTVYNAMTNKPSTPVASAQNTMVQALVTASVWSKLDLFYCFAQESNTAGESLINWKSPGSHNCTTVGSPTWTSLQGFTGASAKYLNTNFTPSTGGGNFTQNSATLGCYTRLEVVDGVETFHAYDYTRQLTFNVYFSDVIYANINGAHSAGYGYWSGGTHKTTKGLSVAVRSDATTMTVYKNAASMGNQTANSTGLPTVPIYIGYDDYNGSYSTNQISIAYVGGASTAGDVTAMYNAVQAYMTTIGSQV